MSRRGIVSALSHRPFALVWSGALVSNVGSWMELVTQHWLVYEVSGSTTWSGLLPFAATMPAVVLSIPMGIVADRVDRRRLLLVFQVAMALVATLQATAAHLGRTDPATIVQIAFLGGIVMGASGPAWHALVPELVPREDLGGAIALNSAQFNVARITGPALAAYVIHKYGVATSFDVNVGSFVLVIGALALIPSKARAPVPDKEPRDWSKELREGLGFAASHRGIARLIPTSALFLLCASPIFALLPALSKKQLHGEVDTFAGLMSSIGLGAIVGALFMGQVARIATRQNAIAVSALVVALSLVGLSVAHEERVAQVLLFAFGVGWCVLLTTQNIAVQHLVPDAMRGRVMSLNNLAFFAMHPLGALGAGYAADVLDLPHVLRGLAAGCLACGVWNFASRVPEMEEASHEVSDPIRIE